MGTPGTILLRDRKEEDAEMITDVTYHDGICSEVLDLSTLNRCGDPGVYAQVAHTRYGDDLAAIGRKIVRSSAYCPVHGGRDRARAEAVRDWDYLAPASVGNSGQVLAAGAAGLTTDDCYVVVREEQPELTTERWEVHTPLTTAQAIADRYGERAMRAIAPAVHCCRSEEEAIRRSARVAELSGCPAPSIRYRAGGLRARKRPWLAGIGLGSFYRHIGAYVTQEEAVASAVAAWRQKVAEHVERIRTARGGVLDWGVEIEPRPEPILVEARPGECTWDAASRTERERQIKAKRGVAFVSGVRPDGGMA